MRCKGIGGSRAFGRARTLFGPGGMNMAVNIAGTRTTSLFTDQDADGVYDPGDVIITKIRITNSGTDPATDVTVTDTLSGVTLVPGSVQVTPIAFDDLMPSIVGNTPITFSSAQL